MLTESFKVLAGTWFFLRGFIKAVITYNTENSEKKLPKQNEILGTGLRTDDHLPAELPSIIDIKKAIPRHCFQPKISTSMYYAVKDLLLAVITYLVFMQVQRVDYLPLNVLATVVYWAVQGTIFTAIFVIGELELVLIVDRGE